jgi:biotin transport system substrate-specific component
VADAPYPKSKGLALVAMFTTILAFCALISIPITPISPVPITLQVFAVYLIVTLLGPRYGTYTCLLYLFLGAIGLPVFSGGDAGVGQIIGPSGGYLISFPVAAFVGGYLSKGTGSSRRSELLRVSSANAASLAIIYTIGVLWLSIVYLHGNIYDGVLLGAVPFIPFDVLKAIVAVPVSLRVRGARLNLPVNSIKAGAGTTAPGQPR